MLQLRRLTTQDLPAYQALMIAGLRAYPDRFRLTEDDLHAEPPPLDGEADGFTIVAERDGSLLGSVSVRREHRAKCRHKALLYRMYVDAAAAGAGVGRQLLAEAVRQARRIDGLRHLNLTVLADNERAIELYGRSGFERFAVEPDAVFAAGRYRDELQMKLVLSP